MCEQEYNGLGLGVGLLWVVLLCGKWSGRGETYSNTWLTTQTSCSNIATKLLIQKNNRIILKKSRDYLKALEGNILATKIECFKSCNI